MLATANLRLRKVVSNSREVMEALPTEDRGKDVRDLDLRRDSLPDQRSLGAYWSLEGDAFFFRVSLPDKPFARRGVLSVVNSIYDPLRLAVPALLEGRLLLQQLVRMGKRSNNDAPLGWDDPLPDALRQPWNRWRSSLPDLEKTVPRCYHPQDFGKGARAEIHAFSDASKDAIGASVYLRLANDRGNISTSLLFGQSKVAQAQATSIPRLELCAAFRAALAVQRVQRDIDIAIDEVSFYTDSKVWDTSRTSAEDSTSMWPTESRSSGRSPALASGDITKRRKTPGTSRPAVSVSTTWPSPSGWPGQDFWRIQVYFGTSPRRSHWTSPTRTWVATHVQKRQGVGSGRFSRFSSLRSLQRAIAKLIVVVREFKRRKNGPGAKPKVGRQNAQTKDRDSPAVHQRGIPRVRSLVGQDPPDARRRRQCQTLGTGFHLSQ